MPSPLLASVTSLVYQSTRRIVHRDAVVTKALTTVGIQRETPVSLYHELHGHGKHKLLFITGWAGSCDNWRFQTDFFGQHGDFEVCIYENRGSGFSSAPKANYQMRDMAQDAVDLMDQLGWKKAHVVGVSMGGMIAQELALLAPSRVESLTLASTCASHALPPIRNIPWLLSSFTQILFGLAKPKNLMPFFLYSRRWLNLPAPRDSGYSSNLEYMLKFHGGRIDSRPPQSFVSAIRQLMGIVSFHISKDRLMGLKQYFLKSAIPAMVIHGTEDALVHLKASWNLATLLGARLVVFEGRGHALNHEDIDLFNRLLLRHFYTAILAAGAPGVAGAGIRNSSLEEAARRAGWFWKQNVVGTLEKQAAATVARIQGNMVGVTEWIVGMLFRKKDGAAVKPLAVEEWYLWEQDPSHDESASELASRLLASSDSPLCVQSVIQALVRRDPASYKDVAMLPLGCDVDANVWQCEQLRQTCLELNQLVAALLPECLPAAENCSEMKAGEWQYLCAAHPDPQACSAIDYIIHTIDSTTALLNNPKYFPSRVTIPTTSQKHFASIARRLYRVFAHAWYHHREVFDEFENESHLYKRFLYFSTIEFKLIPKQLLTITDTFDVTQ
ncbi:hypothetical protein HDU98_005762 [Podochytrium sp. JEL0797]|nr:hypothetical protein HDU98_005762 [Podochytrium sp. JEL0797]